MLRKVIVDLSKHGRRAVEKFAGLGKGKAPQELPAPQGARVRDLQPATLPTVGRQVAQLATKRSTILSRYFSNNVYPNLAQELRQNFQFRLHSGSFPLFGNYRGLSQRLSMYAFVTMGMASWAQLQQDQEGQDAIYDNIRTIIQGKQSKVDSKTSLGVQEDHSIESYEFGPMIAKGCSAAVYQARHRTVSEETCSVTSSDIDVLDDEESQSLQQFSEDSDMEVISEEDVESVPPQYFSMSSQASDIEVLQEESDIEVIDESFQGSHLAPLMQSLPSHLTSPGLTLDNRFDLAIKMMFNYDIESVASAIWREMQNELVPAKLADVHMQMGTWQNGTRARMKRLPPHPNIVDMQRAFVGDVPHLSSAFEQYPDALPERINPDGCGRNKTLFIVMKRYRHTLRDYLHQHSPGVRQCMLLLSQLLEAVVHLQGHNMAHRDLKSDNILVEEDAAGQPHLVVTDFGCCLAESSFGLRVPYLTGDMCKGGNGCLMAPEIAGAIPGINSWLDYTSADLWAVAAIAYEIFRACNPFYRDSHGQKLDSATYTVEQLPPLPDHVPMAVRNLVHQMLAVDPHMRPSGVTAANTLHLLLWSPASWLCDLDTVTLRCWLVTLTAKVICASSSHHPMDSETSLQALFLSRLDKHQLHEATWLLQKCVKF